MEVLPRKFAGALRRLSPILQREKGLAWQLRADILPIPPDPPDEVVNMPLTRLDMPGIDYREGEQLARLDGFTTETHRALFDTLRREVSINKFRLGEDVISNTFCNTPDAEIYASMIAERRPGAVVEVGSGFSTLVARRTVDFLGLPTRIVVFDPFPRTDVRAAAHELTLAPVEQSDLAQRDWQRGDILFIDSSHICRTRGDLPYLFCQVIPSLPAGVLVHVHDIFLPYDYPNLYDPWCHTEEYLLACTLAFSNRYRVVMATHWLSRKYPGRMNAVFGPFAGSDKTAPDHFGASFWFEVTG